VTSATPDAPAGSTTPPTPPKASKKILVLGPAGDPPAGVPAALYASLFEETRAWKLSGTIKHSSFDDRPRHSKESFKATCRVASVGRFSWGMMSEITCKDLPSVSTVDPLTGFWFATAEGLYRATERPGAGGFEVTEQSLIFTASPVASKKEEKEPDGSFGLLRTVEPRGKGWCMEEASWGGDEGWSGRCLLPGVGFTSGRWGWAGGSTHEAEFQAISSK
jgi:hypothetical protein